MTGLRNLQNQIFNINNQTEFSDIALEIFNYQYLNNKIYRLFVQSLGREPSEVNSIHKIPFLPVEFFRNHKILTGNHPVEMIFESSGTTGVIPGKHFVSDLGLYEDSFLKSFRLFYGDPEEYLIAALLPSYTERSGSSLVYMADHLIKKTGYPGSGFYKDNPCELVSAIEKAKDERRKVLLLGVSFALLDLAETMPSDLSGVVVMETGGMKGRRKELVRSELHSILIERLNIQSVHSEYGMTELLSQAYSKGEGLFYCPPWMKIIIRDPQDPLTLFTEHSLTGGINIIDLANINSCSFIATGDLGKTFDDGGFEVLGRFDNSDIRGCNLLVE
jgi:phenylacetate-coenzyme A ligase PaaK-like adenylate-forming protein